MANICKKYVFWMSEKIEGFSRRWVLWRILKFLDFFSCYRFFLETVPFLWDGFTHNFVTIASKIEQSSHGKHLRTSKSVSNPRPPSTVEPWKLFKRFSAFPLSHSAMFVGGCHFASVHQTLCSVVWKEWLFLRHRSAPTRGHHCGHRNRFAWLKVVFFV